MKCVICQHGETRPGTTTMTLERDQMTLVVKSVPAEVCTACGEDYYTDAATTARLLVMLDAAIRDGVLVSVRQSMARGTGNGS